MKLHFSTENKNCCTLVNTIVSNVLILMFLCVIPSFSKPGYIQYHSLEADII